MGSVPETLVLLHGFAGRAPVGPRRAPSSTRTLHAARPRPARARHRRAACGPSPSPAASPTCSARRRRALRAVRLLVRRPRRPARRARRARARARGSSSCRPAPGIEDDDERAARRAEDEALAAEIEGLDGEAFADRWQAQPVFDGTPRRGGAVLARGPAAQRSPRAGRGAARPRAGRHGARVVADRRADDAGHGGGGRPRREVHGLR